MVNGFAPEFLILIGVDVFLGASILAVLLDKHFPTALPYILDGGAIIGFGELLTGPSFVSNLPTELQFYYSFAYAMIAVLTLFGLNLYLLFLRRRPFESAVLGVFATVPSALGMLYFTSAFVNGLTISLPVVPVIPIEGVYILFAVSVGLIVFSLVVFGRKLTGAVEVPEAEPVALEPIPARPLEVPGSTVLSMEAPARDVPTRTSEAPSPDGRASQSASVDSPPPLTAAAGVGVQTPGSEPATESLEGQQTEVRSSGTTLLQQESKRDYAKRLRDSIDFFGKAVTSPVTINPAVLQGVFKDVKRAYLTPAGMVLVEDSAGNATSRSLLELSTDEALKVMREAMKGIGEKGKLP